MAFLKVIIVILLMMNNILFGLSVGSRAEAVETFYNIFKNESNTLVSKNILDNSDIDQKKSMCGKSANPGEKNWYHVYIDSIPNQLYPKVLTLMCISKDSSQFQYPYHVVPWVDQNFILYSLHHDESRGFGLLIVGSQESAKKNK